MWFLDNLVWYVYLQIGYKSIDTWCIYCLSETESVCCMILIFLLPLSGMQSLLHQEVLHAVCEEALGAVSPSGPG